MPARVLAGFLLLCLAVSAVAEAALPASQTAAIERQRAALDQAGLDEAARREADTALAAAETAERAAEAAIEARRQLGEALAAAEKERRALQARLSQEPTLAFRDWQRRLPDSDDPERFEALLAAERGEVLRLRAEAGQVANALAAFVAPPAEASVQEAELRLTIEDLERRLSGTNGADLPPALAEARQLRLRAELRAARAELQRRTVERDSAPLRREHLELRQRTLQRELADREQRVELLQALIADRTDARLTALVEALDAVQPELADTPLLAREHALTLQIARELIAGHAALGELRRELRRREQQRDQVAASLRDTRARLALDSGSEALGLILQAERRRLEESPEALSRRLEQIRAELAQARLRQIDLAHQRAAIDDLDASVRRLLAVEQRDTEDPAAQIASSEALRETLFVRADLLPKLDALLQRRLAALEQTEQALQALHDDTVLLRDLLDRRLLWIPSHARVDLGWLQRQPSGWFDLLKPSRFPTSGKLLLGRWQDAPWVPLAALILAVTLLVWRRGLRERLAALAPPRRVAGDSYRLTAQVFVQTVLASLPWALLLWALGHSLRGAGAAGRYSDSLGQALFALAASALLLDFLRWLAVDRGLAHLHFRWTRARRDSLHAWLPWLAAVLLPAQFFASLAQAREVDLAIDTAGRLSLLVFAVFAAVMLWRVLAPGALWTPRGGAPEPQRKRQLLRFGLPALLGGIVLALFDGYVYSSWVLLRGLWLSMWAVLAVAVAHGLLARWFLLGERRLAWQRLQAQREAEHAEAGSQVDSESGTVELPVTDLTLEQVNAQTGRLLRALTLSLWVAALFLIWADVLPALARLDEITLWSYSTQADDGSSVLEHVSLKGLLLGLIVLVLTFIAAGNLPGLLEIGLLTRISIDASTRYAIASVSRYLIVIVGAMIGLGLLGLRWSQLQWMAAAFSVGLGFGLQEIFGNFVSGLILLFERPFRVGDVITIGEFTGTVSRVRTRATTLIDFDNKEVVVPNKTFITERLINWTLSDTRTRITLKVGVAYGTDPQQVHALLQRAATEHPQVLADPAPRSWFMAFGASSLDFELRVFVDTMNDRLPVTNELNMRIAALFAEHGIEIAFPQLDLRVKEMPEAVAAGDMGAARGAGDAGGAPMRER